MGRKNFSRKFRNSHFIERSFLHEKALKKKKKKKFNYTFDVVGGQDARVVPARSLESVKDVEIPVRVAVAEVIVQVGDAGDASESAARGA